MILNYRKTSEHDRNCLIYLDNSVWGTLPVKVLQTLFLSPAETTELTDSEAETVKAELDKYACQKLTDWLAKQEHCSTEAEEYLQRFRFHPTIISRNIALALERNYINDKRYCRMLIESLLERRKSRQQIKGKLIEKRLPSSLWEPILSELADKQTVLSILTEQAEKVYLQYRHLDRHTCWEKCLTALYRKGFDLASAKEALKKIT